MPRKLPWTTIKAPTKAADRSKTSAKRIIERNSHLAAVESGPKDRFTLKQRRLEHEPSTSPPPAPPPEELMRVNGKDDVWVMVEDEFFSTAQTFSRHLHHAEYKRLKNVAAERTEMHQNNLLTNSNSVNLSMSERTIEGRKSQLEIPGTLNNAEISHDSEDESIIPDRNLANLMRGRKMKRNEPNPRSVSSQKATPHTRAAAGFSRPRIDRGNGDRPTKMPYQSFSAVPSSGDETFDETDDDLNTNDRDISNKHKNLTSTRHTSKLESSTMALDGASSDVSYAYSVKNDFLYNYSPRNRLSRPCKRRKLASSPNTDRKGDRKSIKLDEIPTFLA